MKKVSRSFKYSFVIGLMVLGALLLAEASGNTTSAQFAATETPDVVATYVAATMSALQPATPTPNIIATGVAATLTALQPATATATSTPTPTDTPDVIGSAVAATMTALQAPAQNATPVSEEQLAATPITRNADWTPVEREFNGIIFVLVPAGCFMMGSETGSSNEKPMHEQCFDEPFWISKTEVTNAQFGRASTNPDCIPYSSDEEQPRNCVTWFEAQSFCERLGGHLPTEAEWEYAARGPANLTYPWGNEWNEDNAVWQGNSGRQTAPVGSRPAGASWVGALDMAGNVFERTLSQYQPYPYVADDGRNSTQDITSVRALRGGAFNLRDGSLRATSRATRAFPDHTLPNIGFRCTLPAFSSVTIGVQNTAVSVSPTSGALTQSVTPRPTRTPTSTSRPTRVPTFTPVPLRVVSSGMPSDGDELLQVAFIPGTSDGWIVLFNSNGRSGYVGKGIPPNLITGLNTLIDRGEFIRQIAFTSDGDGWVILFGLEPCYTGICGASDGYVYRNIPSAAASSLEESSCSKTAVAFGQRADDWAVSLNCGNGGAGIDTDNDALSQDANGDNRSVDVILFYGSHWLYVYDGNGWSWSSSAPFSSDMVDRLREINDDGGQIKSIAIDLADEERYVIIWGWNGWSIKGVSDDLADVLRLDTGDSEQTPRPTATRRASTAVPTFAPPNCTTSRLQIGCRAEVYTTDGDGLRLRANPGTSAEIRRTIPAGTVVYITDGPFRADGYTWWEVHAPPGVVGYLVESADGIRTLIPIR